MKITDKDLKSYFKETPEKGKCPEESVFINTFLDKIDETEKKKLIDHVLICDKCALYFKTLIEVAERTREKIEIFKGKEFTKDALKRIAKQRLKQLKKEKRRTFLSILPIKRIPMKSLTLLVGLLIIVFGYFLFFESSKTTKPTEEYRDFMEAELKIIEPQGEIFSYPSVFKWTNLNEAIYYNFELLDSGLTIIWTKEKIKNNLVMLPHNIIKKLQKGKRYFGKVTAYGELNEQIESAIRSFKIL